MTQHAPAGISDPTWHAVASDAKAEAVQLLAHLIADRRMLESRQIEYGLADPIVEVTGCSAIDRAIADVRAMIEGVDRALLERDDEGEALPAVIARLGFDVPVTARPIPVSS